MSCHDGACKCFGCPTCDLAAARALGLAPGAPPAPEAPECPPPGYRAAAGSRRPYGCFHADACIELEPGTLLCVYCRTRFVSTSARSLAAEALARDGADCSYRRAERE